MQNLKQRASNLLGRSGAKQEEAGQAPARAPLQPHGAGGMPPGIAAAKAFVDAAPASQAVDRRHLLQQEAVAGLVQNYCSSLVRTLEDLATAHAQLGHGLRQAGDLAAQGWAGRAEKLAEGLQEHATSSQEKLGQAMLSFQRARNEHKEAVGQLSHCERMARRRGHFEQKVQKLRAEAQQATSGLSGGTLDPTSPSAGSSVLPKTVSGLKTMQADLKLGRLWRNEEKLARVVAQHEESEALASQTLEYVLTVGRKRLRAALDEAVRSAIDELLPGLGDVTKRAAQAAPSPQPLPALGAAGAGAAGPSPAPESPGNAPSNAVMAFAPGDRVLVSGLAKTPQYNGREGLVKSLREDGRVEVELGGAGEPPGGGYPGASKVLALRTENLARQSAAARGAGAPAASPARPPVPLDSGGASAEFLGAAGDLLGLGAGSPASQAEDDSSDGTSAG